MGGASRRKRDRAGASQDRINARAERELQANQARLNQILSSYEIPEIEKLEAHIRYAPRPHGLDELMDVNDTLVGRGWQLQVNGWDDLTWASPRTLADDHHEEIQDAGGWPELNITTDVFFHSPAYWITLPHAPGATPDGRFFTSLESLVAALSVVENHAYGDGAEELWGQIDAFVTTTMPERGPQIAQISSEAELPYPAS